MTKDNKYEEIKKELDDILELNKYLIDQNLKIDKNTKREMKKEYGMPNDIYFKSDYLSFGIGYKINKLHKENREELYNVLLTMSEYELSTLKFILKSLKIIREPYVKFIRNLPAVLFILIPVIFSNKQIPHLEDVKIFKFLLDVVRDSKPYLFFMYIILLPVSIWGREILLPQSFFVFDYTITLIDQAIKQKEKEKNKYNEYSEGVQLIEATKITENKARKETVRIKVENKKVLDENN